MPTCLTGKDMFALYWLFIDLWILIPFTSANQYVPTKVFHREAASDLIHAGSHKTQKGETILYQLPRIFSTFFSLSGSNYGSKSHLKHSPKHYFDLYHFNMIENWKHVKRFLKGSNVLWTSAYLRQNDSIVALTMCYWIQQIYISHQIYILLLGDKQYT